MSLKSFILRTARQPSYAPRRFFWELYRNIPERILCKHTDHGRMAFSSKDEAIGKYLYLERNFDYGSLQQAMALLKRLELLKAEGNSLLIDIGANIGTVCLPLVGQGIFEKAWAIEPAPFNVDLLKKNIEMNRLSEEIILFPVALSAQSGEADLHISRSNPGDHRLGVAGEEVLLDGEAERKTVAVPVKTLDQLVAENAIVPSEVSLIWVDIQGHEPKMIAGAKELLKTRIPMVMEFWPDRLKHSSAEDLNQFFDVLTSSYSQFINLRHSGHTPEPISNLPELMNKTEPTGGTYFTDIILY